MKTALLLTTLVFAAQAASARTWTSADGTKKLEADIVSADGGQVTIRHASGQQRQYPLSMFSAEDAKFVDEWLSQKNSTEASAKPAAPKGALAEELADKLVRLEGRSFKKYEFTGAAPEYFILYFSASW